MKRKRAHHLVKTSGMEKEAITLLSQVIHQRAKREKRVAVLEAKVQIVTEIDPELFRVDGLSLSDLVQSVLEGCVADSKGRPHCQIGIKKVSLKGVARASDDGEGGVGKGTRVELGGSPEDHRIVPFVSFER